MSGMESGFMFIFWLVLIRLLLVGRSGCVVLFYVVVEVFLIVVVRELV